MNRFAARFCVLILVSCIPATCFAAEQNVHVDPSFVTISLADVGGSPAVSLQHLDSRVTARSLTFGTDSNAITITPIDGGIQMQFGTYMFRATELRLNADLKLKAIDMMNTQKNTP